MQCNAMRDAGGKCSARRIERGEQRSAESGATGTTKVRIGGKKRRCRSQPNLKREKELKSGSANEKATSQRAGSPVNRNHAKLTARGHFRKKKQYHVEGRAKFRRPGGDVTVENPESVREAEERENRPAEQKPTRTNRKKKSRIRTM